MIENLFDFWMTLKQCFKFHTITANLLSRLNLKKLTTSGLSLMIEYPVCWQIFNLCSVAPFEMKNLRTRLRPDEGPYKS